MCPGFPARQFAAAPTRPVTLPPPGLQTSMFNVRTALEGNEVLLGIDDYLEAAAERWVTGGS